MKKRRNFAHNVEMYSKVNVLLRLKIASNEST